MGFRLSFNARLYYNTASNINYASPTWSAVAQVKDVNVPIEDGEVELNSRASAFELSAQGLRKMGIEWDCIYDPTDTSLLAMMAAYWNRTNVDLVALDAAITVSGTCGWRIVGCLLMSTKGEALAEGQKLTFKVAPTLQSTQHDPTPVKSDGTNLAIWTFS